MTPTMDRWQQTVRIDVNIQLVTSGEESVVHHSYDHRLWTPRDLIDVAESTGFRVVNVGTWANPLTWAKSTDWKLLFHARRQKSRHGAEDSRTGNLTQ
jgi:hypothetical protein